MGKVINTRYFTKEKKDKINQDNVKLYGRYLKSNILKNQLAEESTYKVYENSFIQFLVYLSEEWDNIGLYSDEFTKNAIDIIEGFMSFCQTTLFNHKKSINFKLSAVSSFYLWSMKRGLIPFHPFDKRVDRMKGADKEKVLSTYFLTQEQCDIVESALIENKDNKYDFMDLLLWKIMLDSSNRIGEIYRLTLSSLDMEEMCFHDIQCKEFYLKDVCFEDDTKILLKEWLLKRENEMDKLEIDSLWIVRYGYQWKKPAKGTLDARIKRIGKIIGLEDFRSHCIRKTSSNLLLEAGVEVDLVAEKLNHMSTSTTLQFYKKPKTSTEVRGAIRKQLAELNELKKQKLDNQNIENNGVEK